MPVAGTERRRAPARPRAVPEARRRLPLAFGARWLPSGRSLAVGFTLVALAVGAYLLARETSLFAVQRIDVQGASPALAARIRSALEPLEGTSLVSFSRGAADHRLSGLPEIAGVGYDRDFPHTLHVRVTVERPVAVLRRAADAWLVAASGRVLDALVPDSYPPLPRIWLAAETTVTVGAPTETGNAVTVATALRTARFPVHVLGIRDDGAGQVVLEVAGGREVRLGDTSNLRVKLAVAAAILPRATDALYLDVSVPTRAVAGYRASDATAWLNSQPSGQG
jgi:cell division septal protein FtsQ